MTALVLDGKALAAQTEAEMLETLPPNLNPYYKKKVSEYFNKLESE